MKKTFYVILGVLFALGIVAYRLYNKPHRQAADEPSIFIEAPVLLNAFLKDEEAANAKFLDNVLEVHGVISSVSNNQAGDQVILLQTGDPMFGISCTLQKPQKNIVAGNPVTIKGFCRGYLSDVVLTDCILIE